MKSCAELLTVGEIVYRSFSPQQCGKVIEDLGIQVPAHVKGLMNADAFFQVVRVKWLRKGNPVTTMQARDLNRIDNLIEDTERKLKGHRDRKAKAEKL